jgi:hypothetical protein
VDVGACRADAHHRQLRRVAVAAGHTGLRLQGVLVDGCVYCSSVCDRVLRFDEQVYDKNHAMHGGAGQQLPEQLSGIAVHANQLFDVSYLSLRKRMGRRCAPDFHSSCVAVQWRGVCNVGARRAVFVLALLLCDAQQADGGAGTVLAPAHAGSREDAAVVGPTAAAQRMDCRWVQDFGIVEAQRVSLQTLGSHLAGLGVFSFLCKCVSSATSYFARDIATTSRPSNSWQPLSLRKRF